MGPNGIQKTEPFLSSGGYIVGTLPFRVDRGRLNGHIFGSIARRKHRTSKTRSPAVAGMDRPFGDLKMAPKGHSRSKVMMHFY